MSKKADRNPEQQKLFALIAEMRIAMLVTQADDGSLRSRPMATQADDSDNFLWFFTDLGSAKVFEIQQEQQVNVSYVDSSSQNYVSVSGVATVTRDSAKIDELWSPFVKAWFPDGKDDPELTLIRVQPTDAEYWDGPSSKFVQITGLLKALVTGEKVEYDSSENRKVSM